MLDGPIAPAMLAFALPVIASNALQSLNGLVNAIWVSRLLGEHALAATSNANFLLTFLIAAMFGLGMAANLMIAQSVGAGQMERLKRIVGTGASVFFGCGVTIAIAGAIYAPDILTLMRTPPESFEAATVYLRVMFPALPFTYMFTLLMMTQRGVGDSTTPFVFMAIAVIADIVLNPILILGIGIAPRLGIAGSALATLIAQIGSLIIMLAVLYRRESPVLLRPSEWRLLRPDAEIVGLLATKGLPMGLQMMVITGIAVAMIRLINPYGVHVVAAYGAASQLWTYIQMPALGIAAAVAAMAAQNVGADRWDRIASINRTGVLFGLVITLVGVVLVFALQDTILTAFLPNDESAVEQAEHINSIVLWAFVLLSTTLVMFGTVRSTGAVLAPLAILTTSLWIVRLPFAIYGQRWLGAEAIWWSFPIGAVISVALAVLYYRFGKWRDAKLFKDAAPVIQQ